MKITVSKDLRVELTRQAKRQGVSPGKLVNRYLTYALSVRCDVCNRPILPLIVDLQATAHHPTVCSIGCLVYIDPNLLVHKLVPDNRELFHTLHDKPGYWVTDVNAQTKCTSCNQVIIHNRLDSNRTGYGKGAVIVTNGAGTRYYYYCLKCCFPADPERTSSFYLSLPSDGTYSLPYLIGA